VREKVTRRSKIVGMISFVLDNVREEIVVHVSGQLRRRGIVGGVQTKPDRTSHRHIRQLVCNKVVIKYPIVIMPYKQRSLVKYWCRKKSTC